MKNIFKNFLIFFIIFLVIAGLFSMYSSPLQKSEEVSINQLIDLINKEEVKSIEVSQEELKIVLKDDTQQKVRKESTESFSVLMKNYDVSPEKLKLINIMVKDGKGLSFWLASLLPFLIPFLDVSHYCQPLLNYSPLILWPKILALDYLCQKE